MKSHFEAWPHPDDVELTHQWAAKLATVAAGRSLVPSQMCSAPEEAGALSTRTLGPRRAPLVSSPNDLLMVPRRENGVVDFEGVESRLWMLFPKRLVAAAFGSQELPLVPLPGLLEGDLGTGSLLSARAG